MRVIVNLIRVGEDGPGVIRHLCPKSFDDLHSDNILYLCTNHHVMFDKGSFSIKDDFNLLGEI